MPPESYDVTLSVATALARFEGVPPQELEFAIHDHINTEALELLMTSRRSDWVLEFRVPGYTVSVRGSGEVTVTNDRSQEVITVTLE